MIMDFKFKKTYNDKLCRKLLKVNYKIKKSTHTKQDRVEILDIFPKNT